MSSYEETGVLKSKELKKRLPSKRRLEKGGVAIIECVQRIPCDPCAHVCRFGAIRKESLTSPPEIDYDKCTGCGECVSLCPGLAIFVVNLNYKEDKALIMIPYEFSPAPKKGEVYEALDREGRPVGQAKIVTTKMNKDRTATVLISVDKSLAMVVRNIGRRFK